MRELGLILLLCIVVPIGLLGVIMFAAWVLSFLFVVVNAILAV